MKAFLDGAAELLKDVLELTDEDVQAELDTRLVRPFEWVAYEAPAILSETIVDQLLDHMFYDIERLKYVPGDHRPAEKARILDGLEQDYSVVSKKGKFAKRLSKVVFSMYGFDLPNASLDRIARAIEYNTLPDAEVRIVEGMSWSAGEFRDGNSCYWGVNTHHRAALIANDVLALQARRKSDQRALGRVLILNNKNRAYMFNSYGLNTHAFSAVLAGILGEPIHYAEVRLALEAKHVGLYTNGGEYVFCRAPLKDKKNRSLRDMQSCGCVYKLMGRTVPEDVTKVCDNCPWPHYHKKGN